MPCWGSNSSVVKHSPLNWKVGCLTHSHWMNRHSTPWVRWNKLRLIRLMCGHWCDLLFCLGQECYLNHPCKNFRLWPASSAVTQNQIMLCWPVCRTNMENICVISYQSNFYIFNWMKLRHCLIFLSDSTWKISRILSNNKT